MQSKSFLSEMKKTLSELKISYALKCYGIIFFILLSL